MPWIFAFKFKVFRFILFIYVLTAFQASQARFRPANCCQEIRLHWSFLWNRWVFLLDIFPKPIFAQKFLRKSKLAWGCYNYKKVFQTPKVILTLPSTNRKTCTRWLWFRLRSAMLTNPILLKTLESYDRRDLNDIFFGWITVVKLLTSSKRIREKWNYENLGWHG